MAIDPKQPIDRDTAATAADAEEAKLIADADEGEETLPEFADARDAGAGDTLADAGEGAHIEGVVRAGLTMVPEVTVDFDASTDPRSIDREVDLGRDADTDLAAERARDPLARPTGDDIEDRPIP